ncbi:hypothetical protein [Stenotrophomonas sp. VV52]|uniref:hypothetical protein n=1 Tax=Stenotrophomonas sp. VV52 TaxID=2066958 RepID=UPI000C9DE864|nr:hypothetical protein [Stenotrophomonas sp. VV52]
MDVKQSPFSLYDFLGYLFPGAIAIFAFEYIFSYLGLDTGLTELTALTRASALLPFILSSYIAGHLISLLSSFTIERLYIWTLDYPSKSLLSYERRAIFEDKLSALNCVKFVCLIILAPVALGVLAMCFFSAGRPGLAQSMDNLLTKIIRLKITRLLIEKGQVDNPNRYAGPCDSDFFRFVYHHALENSPAHIGKMQNYVALFGFHRAMSFLCCLLFWIGIVSVVSSSEDRAMRVVVASSVLSLFFFFGFAKFYRRFSLEALMAMAVTYFYPPEMAEISVAPVHPSKREGFSRGRHSQFSAVLNDLNRRITTTRDRRKAAKAARGG